MWRYHMYPHRTELEAASVRAKSAEARSDKSDLISSKVRHGPAQSLLWPPGVQIAVFAL